MREPQQTQVVLTGTTAEEALNRLTEAILTRHPEGQEIALVGIQTGGVKLAQLLAGRLMQRWGATVPVGALDISMHRDDLGRQPMPNVHPTSLPFDLASKSVILVDDVLYSGRTTRAALDALSDFGRPQRVELAVLVDRGHRELPIRADFVGTTLPTAADERVQVEFGRDSGTLKVLLEKVGAG